MSLRRAAKRDCNEDRIVAEFERAGAVVQKISEAGVPDLVVEFLGSLHWAEVKFENAPLTPVQKTWHDDWVKRGGKRPEIVRSEAHAKKLLRIWTMQFAEAQSHGPSLEDDLGKEPEHGE